MTASFKKHCRIEMLHKAAKTGKYDWKQLKEMAMKIPVGAATAKIYLDEVEERLKKEGLLK